MKRDLGQVVVRSFRIPTEEVGIRLFAAQTECWANTPCKGLGGGVPWELALTEQGRRTVERWLAEELAVSGRMLETYQSQLETVRDPRGRRVEAYGKSGGLLNLFGETVTEKDDDTWYRLVEERIEKATFPDEESRLKAVRETERLWNDTPSELFGGLTPAQTWAGGGPRENKLLQHFMECFDRQFDPGPFDSRGHLIKRALLFIRHYQVAPQKSLAGGTPAQTIVQERDRILREKMGLLRR